MRSEPETARPLSLPARTSACLWEHSRCLSSACIVVGAATVTPAENFVSPLSESSPSPRKHNNKKKVSVAARQSVHPSERSPTLPSSSGLCVRQIENEQQSTVGEVSGTAAEGHGASWQVDWLAQTTLYQVSQAQTAS